MPRLLALQDLGDGEDGSTVVLCGCAAPRQRSLEAAGLAFFDHYEKKRDNAQEKRNDPASDGAESAPEERDTRGKKKDSKKKKEREDALKLPEVLKGEDLYALLDLDAGASQDDLRKAYRKMCLVMHPDKQGADKVLNPEEKEAMNVRFVKLQAAFELLNDPKKRRKYDSIGDFDESIPTTLKEGQNFFKVFGPVFKRNAKWSERKPVPELGGPEVPYTKVKSFYEWWRDFESWRDLDEKIMEEMGEDCFQDLEEAECREERRWMERENAKLRSKFMKVERQRIMRLIDAAEKHDPRILEEKERNRQAREAEKAEKEQKRLEAERAQREEEERQAALEREAEEARKAEKARKEEQRLARKAARTKLKQQVIDLQIGIYPDQLQEFLLTLEQQDLVTLSEAIKVEPKAELVITAMQKKGFEPIIVKEDERSTAEGSGSDGEPGGRAPPPQRRPPPKPKEETEEERKKKEEEAAKVAKERAAREAKKKADQEMQDRERRKLDKKESDRLKREEKKKEKEAEQAAEKARQEKEEAARRAEEQREKAKQEKEQAAKVVQEEALQAAFERDRVVRLEAFEKAEWSAVVEAAAAAASEKQVSAALAAINGSITDPEEVLDAKLAALGSFFWLGVRLDKDAPALSSALRNKVKKHRMRLRTAMTSGDLLPDSALCPAAANEESLRQTMQRATGQDNSWLLLAAEPAGPAVKEVAEEAKPPPAAGPKKKAKAKAAPKEDFDAVLAEFAEAPAATAKPKKGGKKK